MPHSQTEQPRALHGWGRCFRPSWCSSTLCEAEKLAAQERGSRLKGGLRERLRFCSKPKLWATTVGVSRTAMGAEATHGGIRRTADANTNKTEGKGIMEMAEAGYRCKTRPAMMLMLVASRGRIKGTTNGFPMDGSNQSGITTQGRGPNPAGMGYLDMCPAEAAAASTSNELLTAATPQGIDSSKYTGSTALMRRCFPAGRAQSGHISGRLSSTS